MEIQLPYEKIFLCEVCGKTFGEDQEERYQSHLAHPPWETADVVVGQMVELANVKESLFDCNLTKDPHFITSIDYSKSRDVLLFGELGRYETPIKLHQLHVRTRVYLDLPGWKPIRHQPEPGKPKTVTFHSFSWEDFVLLRDGTAHDIGDRRLQNILDLEEKKNARLEMIKANKPPSFLQRLGITSR